MEFKKLYEKYNLVTIPDDGAFMSRGAKSFASYVKRQFKEVFGKHGITVDSFMVGHYYFSGFLSCGGKYVYFSYNIPRYGEPIRFDTDRFLIRTAKSQTDYTGGHNNYAVLADLVESVENLFKKGV